MSFSLRKDNSSMRESIDSTLRSPELIFNIACRYILLLKKYELFNIFFDNLYIYIFKEMLRNPSWDGTYIGSITRKDILIKHKLSYCPLVINLIKFVDIQIWCLIKKCQNDFICFYDEVKSFFGIRKQGTNILYIGNIRYNICKFYEIKPLQTKEYVQYKEEISRIFIYRMMTNVCDTSRDIYLTQDGRVLELAYGKKPGMFKMKNTYMDRFFPKYLDLEKKTMEMLKTNKETFEEDMNRLRETIKQSMEYILYKEVGVDIINEFCYEMYRGLI